MVLPGHRPCTGHNKRTGKPCDGNAMDGSTKCYMHGGKPLRGIAHPNFKDGRFSKALPPHLRTRYDAGRADPNLLVLQDEIALTGVHQELLIERLNGQDWPTRWGQVKSAYSALKDTYQMALDSDDGDLGSIKVALAALGRTIDEATPDDGVWKAIHAVNEQRRVLAESERKRLVELQQTITASQTATLFATLTESIMRHVTDRNARAAISADLVRIISIGDGDPTPPIGES